MTIEAEYIGLTANQLAKIASDLKAENAKLRELVAHYEYAVTVYDVKPVEVLEWSTRCGALRKELGIKEDE